jgi:hypothetical protein
MHSAALWSQASALPYWGAEPDPQPLPFGALFVPETLDGPTLDTMLTCLVELNVTFLRRHPRTPRLYESGVRYNEEVPGQEHWLTIPWVLAQGWADCEDLCAYRVAELRAAGERSARCVWSFHHLPGKLLAHIRVRRGNGKIEDPSAILGMGQVGGGARWSLLPYRF